LQSKLPRDLENICLKCLEKDQRQRYSSAQELADDVQRFLANEPTRARPLGVLRRLGKWIRRRPAASALIGVLVLAVLGSVLGLVGFAAILKVEVAGARRE